MDAAEMSNRESVSNDPDTTSNVKPAKRWFKFFGQARTRILLCFLLLMGFFAVVSIPLMQYFIFSQIDQRVREDLMEDRDAFRQLLSNDLQAWEQFNLNGKEILFPRNDLELGAFFDLYLSRRVPEDDTFFIAIAGNTFHRSSPKALPKSVSPETEFIQQLASLTQPTEGEKQNSGTLGNLLYIVEPIKVGQNKIGTLIFIHATAGERAEAVAALTIVIKVTVAALVASAVLGWIVAGKLLEPLQTLTQTAHAISESDLTQRISVKGDGELAKLAFTFNDMMDRLEAAFSTQRNFINDAGHELRTPITIIRGHLELMDDITPEQEETLLLVIDELDRMSRFVEDLILLARAERPDFLQLEPIDVKLLTEELLTKATALAPRNWKLDAAAIGLLKGDRQRITEAMMNLAQNATQHTQVDNTVAIGSSVTKKEVKFWVRDTGEGIAASDQQRIFERFARAANGRRRSEGAGLGLSIAKAITEAHGGTIHLYSKLGTGSTFTLTLPLDPSQEVVTHESSHSDRGR
jgi:signal transduction histidine kinase